MGQVSTELTYAGHNTYRMDPYEEMHATMFDVSLYSDIVIQLVTINLVQATTATLNLCWIDGENKRIGNIATEPVTILKRFSDYWKAFSVPENAKRLHWWIKAGSVGFNWACSMATPGTVPRAFDSNMANRIAMMDINGTYTSTVRADQVIVGPDTLTGRVSFLNAQGLYTSKIRGDQVEAGIIESIDGKMYIRLDSPSEIYMEGTDAILTINPSNPLKVTDKNGNPLGGLMNIEGNIVLTSEYITTPADPIVAASVGTVVGSDNISHTGFIVWAKKADGTYERSLLISPDQSGQLLRMYGPGFNTWLAMYGTAQGTIYLRSEHCGLSMIHGSTNLFIDNNDGKDEVFLSLATDGSETKASLSAKRNDTSYGEIGLDSDGPYAIRKNGTKIYL